MMLPATKISLTTPPWMKKFGVVASNVLCNFIHFQHFLSWTGSRGVTGVYPNWLRAEGRIHFELVTSQSQGTERDRRTFTPTYTPSPITRWPYTSPACVPLHHQRFPTQFQFSKKFIGLLVLHSFGFKVQLGVIFFFWVNLFVCNLKQPKLCNADEGLSKVMSTSNDLTCSFVLFFQKFQQCY